VIIAKYSLNGGEVLKSPENGFTGLEAAIVLIAFVVVAAVFSYVVLGAGFFTTQTAQATVHTGVAQASSSIEIVGNVMGVAVASTPTRLTYINTSVALTAGGRNPNISTNTDLSSCDHVFSDQTTSENWRWCVSQKINDLNTVPNGLLEPNEIWVLSIGMPPTAKVNKKINVNFQPAVGAVISLSRTVPGAISPVQPLY
jgi:flagellin FlaB